MPDFPDSDSTTGFHRQRRNLILGSLALLFMQVANVTLTPQGNALGLTFTIARPAAVSWFLWSAVVYWLVRYYQYHRVARSTQLIQAAREDMVRRLRPRAIQFITPKRPDFTPPAVKEGETYQLIPHDFSPTNFMSRSRLEGIVNPAWLISLEDGRSEIRNTAQYNVVFTGWHLWQARLLGYLKAATNTPYFTEFIAPYIFFALPLLYAFLAWVRA